MTDQTTHTGDIEVLSFRLGSEEYGISILKVQEIRGYEAVTRIANAPAFLKGVINLRGQIVPIVDMRLSFKLGSAAYDSFTVVIILNIGQHVIGMVVDGVSDVVTLSREQVRPAPHLGGGIDAECLHGLGTVGDRMLILLDIERLMTAPDMGLVSSAALPLAA
ncbi:MULTISPECIES: chemotaxis protein CheW [unclassified Massilia]|uniref:chemotaxis protein CheW n=1 Tax=unclassified Massilia TaxID=2609279 RepID=UPI00177AB2ED|nr:chemotaxis protein CheW [Massilia sp. CFBP 13647]MBD8676410.1 chemotaxis protein CheW [Massilia sp. CFBP 13721]